MFKNYQIGVNAMTDTITLVAGTLLFHGTNCDDFNEKEDSLDGPAWLSSSKSVALHFATRRIGYGGSARIISYRLAENVCLPAIYSGMDMKIFAEAHDISLTGVDDIRESVDASGIEGWIIPYNYPNGDDILIVETSVLIYDGTEYCKVL